MSRYLATFDAGAPRAALVHMPTGSGKTAVIASLARCLERTGPVLVVTPRSGLRRQLADDIGGVGRPGTCRRGPGRFFQHAGVDDRLLPRKVVELDDGGTHPGNLEKLVLVATVQLLSSLRRHGRGLYKDLQRAALVLFDEGHYEPAVVWSDAVRSLRCPRIVFTATPFRDDFKLFDVDPKHVYRYTFARACRERYIRSVTLHARKSIRSPDDFADEVVNEYDRLFGQGDEEDGNRPRAIIRCDNPEEIRQLATALRGLGRSVVAIHETFDDRPEAGEYQRVPNPDTSKETFWVHQFKLLEGIDDPRFQLLALYSDLRSVRSFVQQVGRVIRNPQRARGAVAHVLDHSRRQRQTRLWNSFLAYDRLIEQGGDDPALDLNSTTLVNVLTKAVPRVVYVDGRLRAPIDIAQLELEDLQLPLSTNVLDKPHTFSLNSAQDKMIRQCEEEDLLFCAPRPTPDTAAIFYVQVDSSPLLENGFFAEPRFGLSVIHARGRYLFVFDSGTRLAFSASDAAPVDSARLRKLYVESPGTRLTHVSMVNANLGADQVRARAIAAARVERLVPSFDEHAYVLRTATGYSRGRGGSDQHGEGDVRRYIGIESGRVSDLGGRFVPFDEWASWTGELERVLEGTQSSLQVFKRWASDAPIPADPTPRNVLLDLADVMSHYLTTGADGLPEDTSMEVTDLCAEVHTGAFSVTLNGKPCEVQIAFDNARERYELRSSDLDRRYYSTDFLKKEGVTRYLNRSQSMRVIPATSGHFYTLGHFYRPLIKFGPRYDDAKMGVLSSLVPIVELGRPLTEKGKRCQLQGQGWEKGCLFDLIDKLGRGTRLKPYLADTQVLVCDDLNDESADFILVQKGTASQRRRVVLLHAKASYKGSKCSAEALQDVCGQAQKNLSEVSLFADPGRSKRDKWRRRWNGRPHTAGFVKNRIRKTIHGVDPESEVRRVVKDPASEREVWLVLGNLLSKSVFTAALMKEVPPPNAIQTAYLLLSSITNVAAAGARLTVFCAP